jgi:glutamate dehydrogenase/leucine dehydrogenase
MQENNEIFTRESVLVFTKEVLAEMKSKVKNFEVTVTGFTNIPIYMVLDFVNFLYSLIDNIGSS